MISIVLPCYNEEESLEMVVNKIREVMSESKQKLGEDYEVILADNGSTDKSREIAERLGCRVTVTRKRGYGAALLGGFSKAKGEIIVFADADNSYDFMEVSKLIKPLEEGESDLVVGSRLGGRINEGSMPFLHRYVGNPILTFVLNTLFHTQHSDAHTGYRAITKKALKKLTLNCTGMEFSSEMLIQAKLNNLRVAEVPITYWPRKGVSKLKSFRDGFRHLIFILKEKFL